MIIMAISARGTILKPIVRAVIGGMKNKVDRLLARILPMKAAATSTRPRPATPENAVGSISRPTPIKKKD